jgi:hypothetical protein
MKSILFTFFFLACAVRYFLHSGMFWVLTSLLTKIQVLLGVKSYRQVVTDISQELSASETSVNIIDTS